MRVILVRHAMPEVDPGVPPRLWHLGAAGEAAARALTPALPADAVLVASTEPKAAETLQAAAPGRAVLRNAGFDEVHQPAEWRDDHRERARAYVEGTSHPDWEPQPEVAARFTAAIARHAGARPLVVASHGLAITCWLAAQQLLTQPPGVFWAALTFPDVIDLSLPTWAPGP
ncbi:histidine phosphatase family protein [Actinoplanes sp. Pm04-4]|uniref:Histidine phosphatase family protein n=1 Tax=Paractinoplanes pyxinae TaxID=2997416 RepID=A0ABT4BA49_9ACTN|nr:histidine phosphatase family protein [Actinoplanes pyxinae]MCY1143341.1 histidine phosphatase family protein [Actinoplanes pyxinae]